MANVKRGGDALLQSVLSTESSDLVTDWRNALTRSGAAADTRTSEGELLGQVKSFLGLVQDAVKSGRLDGITGTEWQPVRDFLADLSRKRAEQGFTSEQTATFVFSLKPAIYTRLQAKLKDDPVGVAQATAAASELVDALGLHTVNVFQKSREDVIRRQQEEMLELSTPVVKLWEGVLALPMIGTLDSARTQVVMESLLQRIVETGSEIAIIDITGVPTVDTLVAQHLLKTVTAIRLMGAEAIISGIRPQIAQTIVHLGVDLAGVTTKASLADALAIALKRNGYTVTRAK
ncbi:MAG: STAS domain-containing protein [Tepidisphaeraceae bacterium]